MKKMLCIAAAAFAMSGAAFADEAPVVERQEAVVLDDAQLDSATGGLLSVLNGFLNSNSGLVNANVAVPVNVSNIALLSNGKQTSSQGVSQGVSTGNTGLITHGSGRRR